MLPHSSPQLQHEKEQPELPAKTRQTLTQKICPVIPVLDDPVLGALLRAIAHC